MTNVFTITGALIAIAAMIGWIMNIYKLVYMFLDNAPIAALFIGRIVGVFMAPIGGVLGYF